MTIQLDNTKLDVKTKNKLINIMINSQYFSNVVAEDRKKVARDIINNEYWGKTWDTIKFAVEDFVCSLDFYEDLDKEQQENLKLFIDTRKAYDEVFWWGHLMDIQVDEYGESYIFGRP